METTTRAPLTRASIVATTRALIAEEGVDAVSLRHIATTLGVTAPALYAYVSDKRDLLRAVAESAFDDLRRRFAAIDIADPVELMCAHSRAYIMYAVENPALFRVMFLFPPDLTVSERTGDELRAATTTFDAALQAVQAATDAGEFGDADPVMTALTMWTVTQGIADVLLMGFGFDDATRDQLIDDVHSTVIKGLRVSSSHNTSGPAHADPE